MLAYLFNNTRHWAERWIGKLVALALLELLVAIELKIVLVQYQTEMGKVEGLSGSGMDATEAISMLWSLGWIFLFGAVVMVALPAIAAAIGGSHVSNVVVDAITMAPLGYGSHRAPRRPSAGQPRRPQSSTARGGALSARPRLRKARAGPSPPHHSP